MKEAYKPFYTQKFYSNLLSEYRKELTNGSTKKFIHRELDKSITEIENRIEHESSWFEIKFIFIGGILLGFIALIYKEGNKTKDLIRIIQRPGIILALGLSVIVAVIIDMQLRATQKTIHLNGIWIANYIEPLFLDNHVYRFRAAQPFYPWESFLRIKDRGSLFRDTLNSLTFWPHVFLVTILLYLAFIIALKYNSASKESKIIVFIIVHFILIFCVSITHIVPNILDAKVFGLFWVKDNRVILMSYLPASVAMMASSALAILVEKDKEKELEENVSWSITNKKEDKLIIIAKN